MLMNALQAFDFEQTPVRTVLKDGVPWFVLADVCRVLDIVNPSQAAQRLDEDEKGICNSDTLGGEQKLLVVNESGLYALIFASRKDVARRFRKWVTAEVLPTLRATGAFVLDAEDERQWPVSADGRLWGQPVAKVNAAARMVGVVNRIYGPEAARSLYEREPGLPPMRGFSIGELVNTPGDDPAGCVAQLLRAATSKGPVSERLSLAFHDTIAAKALQVECGLIVMPKADGGPAVAVLDSHKFLVRVFAETQWCGAWRHALVNVPGARAERRLKAVVLPRAALDAPVAVN